MFLFFQLVFLILQVDFKIHPITLCGLLHIYYLICPSSLTDLNNLFLIQADHMHYVLQKQTIFFNNNIGVP